MKLFKKQTTYQLVTESSWGNSKINELVLEGTKSEIEEYAKQSNFAWIKDETEPIGGFYTRSIDGYREQKYKVTKKIQ